MFFDDPVFPTNVQHQVKRYHNKLHFLYRVFNEKDCEVLNDFCIAIVKSIEIFGFETSMYLHVGQINKP